MKLGCMTHEALAGDPRTTERRIGVGVGYWQLWYSATMSNLADGIIKVALPLIAIHYTRSPTLIANLTFAFTLPWLVLALPAGTIVDRSDRRAVMVGANLARGCLLAVLLAAVLLNAGTILMLYAVALLVGVAETFYDTASQAILPQLVRREQLMRANSLLYAAETTALELVGPPLAGLMVAASVGLSVGTPAAFWAVAVVLLLLIRGSFRVQGGAGHVLKSLRADTLEGLRFLVRHRLLRTITLMTGVFNFASSAVFAIFVLYAVGPATPLKLTGSQYGLLLSAAAAGWLVGSFLTKSAVRVLGRSRAIFVSYLLGGISIGIPAVTSNGLVIGAVLFIGGIGLIVGNVVTLSLRQMITPPQLLGRINSCHRLFSYGTKPLGALAGGAIGEILGLHMVFVVMGPLAIATVCGVAVLTDRAMDNAEREAEDGDGGLIPR
jgi:MFS family permease